MALILCIYICPKLVNAMYHNKLMLFVIIFVIGSLRLSAQCNNEKNDHQITIEYVKPLSLKVITAKDKQIFKTVNVHRDLINSTVKDKIKCTLDLFIIFRDKATC